MYILLIFLNTIGCNTRLYFVYTVVLKIKEDVGVKIFFEEHHVQTVNAHISSHSNWSLTLSGSQFFSFFSVCPIVYSI